MVLTVFEIFEKSYFSHCLTALHLLLRFLSKKPAVSSFKLGRNMSWIAPFKKQRNERMFSSAMLVWSCLCDWKWVHVVSGCHLKWFAACSRGRAVTLSSLCLWAVYSAAMMDRQVSFVTKFTDPFFNCFLLKFMENWQCICTVKVLTMQVVWTVWTPHWFKNLPTCWTALNFGCLWSTKHEVSWLWRSPDFVLFFFVKLNQALVYVTD